MKDLKFRYWLLEYSKFIYESPLKMHCLEVLNYCLLNISILFGKIETSLFFWFNMIGRLLFISALILAVKGQGNFDTIAFVQKWPICKNKTLCPLKGNYRTQKQ